METRASLPLLVIAKLLLALAASLLFGLAFASSPASAATCPSEQSIMPYSGNDPPYTCGQKHNSSRITLKPWASKTWSKTISYGYDVKSHCWWRSDSSVSVSESWSTSSYTATATNWDVSGDHNWAAGVLFTVGNVDNSAYKSGCDDHKGNIKATVLEISDLKVSSMPTTATVGAPYKLDVTGSPSGATGTMVLLNDATGQPVADQATDPGNGIGQLSGGRGTITWVPREAGTYKLRVVYQGNDSACPSAESSTCGYGPAQHPGSGNKPTTVTVSSASSASAAATSSTDMRAASAAGDSAPEAGTSARMPFGVTTPTKTRTMPDKLSVSCPRKHVVMHAETFTDGAKDAPIKVTRRDAKVSSGKAARGQVVSLQLTCRQIRAPLAIRGGLGYGTPKDDKLTTRRRSGMLFGGPGADRLRLHNRSEVAYGGLGKDRIMVRGRDGSGVGGPGRDRLVARTPKRVLLVGGPGRDRLIGSHGEGTRIHAKDGQRDVVICRSVRNRVLVDRKDVLRGPCSGAKPR